MKILNLKNNTHSLLMSILSLTLVLSGCNKNDTTHLDNNVGIEVADENFKAYILNNFDTDFNGSISEEEIANVKEIDFENVPTENNNKIVSLEGIEVFTNLEKLICGSCCELTSIDMSKLPKVRELNVQNQKLKSLDLSSSEGVLRYLNILDNADLEEIIVWNKSFFKFLLNFKYNTTLSIVGKDGSTLLKNYVFTPEVSFKMINVPAGSFTMGGNYSRNEASLYAHKVNLTKDYFMAETEVTQGLYEYIMGTNPSDESTLGINKPVNMLNWPEAQEFISKLNEKTGENFRLPTEAEWEYAACLTSEGADKTTFYSGSATLANVGWAKSNSNGVLHEVKELQPNFLGLYDMAGNVMEWCNDFYEVKYSEDEVSDPQGPKEDYRIAGLERDLQEELESDEPDDFWIDDYKDQIERAKTNPYRVVRGGNYKSFKDVLCASKNRSGYASVSKRYSSLGLRFAL